MAQIKLITIADFTEDTIYLPPSLDNERISTCIDEAQNADLKPLLGAALFADLLINLSDAKYQKLLLGENYTNANNERIIFNGLKMAVIYFTMAHFELLQQDTYTSHGTVRKTEFNSEPISSKEIARKAAHYKAIGLTYWNEAAIYLQEKKTIYPLYKNGCEQVISRSIKINAI